MLINRDINPNDAIELFQDEYKVLELISGVKWEDGFKCRSCGHDNYCEGKTPFSRRCTRCKKEESATSHTIFHNIKFPVNKAFYIAWNVCREKRDLSAGSYAEQLGINPMTCWKFRKRINDCMATFKEDHTRYPMAKILLNKDFMEKK